MSIYRVHLVEAAGTDYVTVYLPLLDDMTIDEDGHTPLLLKSLWEGQNIYYGEFCLGDSQNYFEWGAGYPTESRSITDLMTVPLKKGAQVHIWNGATVHTERYTYIVREIERQ